MRHSVLTEQPGSLESDIGHSGTRRKENEQSKSQTLVEPVGIWHESIGIDENLFSIGNEATQLVNVVVLRDRYVLNDPFGMKMQRYDWKSILQGYDVKCGWKKANELRHRSICYTKCEILGAKDLS